MGQRRKLLAYPVAAAAENSFVAPHQFGERGIAFDRIGIDKFQEGKEAAITFVFHPGPPQSFSRPPPLLLIVGTSNRDNPATDHRVTVQRISQ